MSLTWTGTPLQYLSQNSYPRSFYIFVTLQPNQPQNCHSNKQLQEPNSTPMRNSTLLFLLLIATGCQDNDIAKGTPPCIIDMINSLKKEGVRNPPAKVFKYTYEGKTVYYIPPYCCDAFSNLLDDQCNLICHPDGGISGRGDGKCPDLSRKLLNKEIVWEDDRK